MIVTARQLEELHRDGGKNGRVTLKPGTRLSPLARDWVCKARVEIEYVETNGAPHNTGGRHVVWWCDGPCPLTKAALMMQESFVNLRSIKTSSDSSHTAIAARKMADEISSRRADAGVLLVTSAGAATVHANRLNELRAVVATSVESLDVAMKSIKPNVLIVEHIGLSLMLTSTILARFLRGGGTK